MDWSAPVSSYCERSNASFWAEPLNAATNAAFLIAAAVAFHMWRRGGGRDQPALALIVVVVAVGLGSFTFHTVATRGAALADTIPIAIFIYGYLLLALRRFLHVSPAGAVAIVLAYGAIAQTLPLMVSPGGNSWRDAARLGTGGGDLHIVAHAADDRSRRLRRIPARHAFPLASAQCQCALSAAAHRDQCNRQRVRPEALKRPPMSRSDHLALLNLAAAVTPTPWRHGQSCA
jgi:hypothetical protein